MEKVVTDRQAAYIKDLFGERKKTLEKPEYKHILSMELSPKLIDVLKRVPKDPREDIPELVAQSPRYGTNKFEKPCFSCGHNVHAGHGFFFSKDGKFHTHHKKDGCLEQAGTTKPGLYVVDGRMVMLYGKPDNLRGKVWDGNSFHRLPFAESKILERGREATEEEREQLASEAGSVGINTNVCQFCMKALTDDAAGASVERGYGPVCADKYGLPWGNT